MPPNAIIHLDNNFFTKVFRSILANGSRDGNYKWDDSKATSNNALTTGIDFSTHANHNVSIENGPYAPPIRAPNQTFGGYVYPPPSEANYFSNTALFPY